MVENPIVPDGGAARLRALLTALFAGVAVLLVTERLGYAGLYRGASGAEVAGALPRQLLYAAPAILLLGALWQLRQAVASVAEGALFGGVLVGALKRVGALLIAGGLTTMLAMPAAHRLLGDPYPRLIEFDVATLILAAIGAALIFLARLFERAGAAQRELDEFF